MTPQPRVTTRRAAVGLMVLAAAGMIAFAGCDPRTLIYFLQPNDPTVPAPGPSLKGKKVVVLTTAAPTALTDYQAIDRELNRELLRIFREKVKKVELVDSDKVATWIQAHPTWTDPGEVAKAFEADIVVFLEINSFSIEDFKSPGLLEGNSEVHIQVVELAHPKNSKGKVNNSAPKEANKIYEEDWKTIFPKRGPVSLDSGVSRSVFKTKFLKLVASELSWQFVEHATGDDIQDVKFNDR